jgi:hypothetical protein
MKNYVIIAQLPKNREIVRSFEAFPIWKLPKEIQDLIDLGAFKIEITVRGN